MSAIAMITADAAGAAAGYDQRLRSACDELAGMAFFGEMLRQAREGGFENELTDSGAEGIFASQLDDVLVQRGSGGLGRSIGEMLYQRLSGHQGPSAGIDVKA